MINNQNNFTPLRINKNTQGNLKKMVDLASKLSSAFLFLSFIAFFINVVAFNFFIYFQKTSKAKSEVKPKFYQPNYKKIDDINFLPQKINEIKLNKDKIYQYYKKKYPALKEEDLIKLINRRIFSYIVIKNSQNPQDYQLLNNFDGDSFENQIEAMINQYQQNTKKIDFYYFKVRFIGTFKENLKKLEINPDETEKLAEKKINFYHQLPTTPNDLMIKINQDKQILILNNEEKPAEKIKKYDHITPLFDDPDFYQYLINTPMNKYSDIYRLKTKNPFSPNFEEYAFIFFYIENIEGENIPLELKINQFIARGNIF